MSASWLLYAVVAPVVFWASRRWPVTRARWTSRLLLHAMLALTSSIAWSAAGRLLYGDSIVGAVPAANTLSALPAGIAAYICVAGLAHAVAYSSEARKKDMARARQAEQLTGARLPAIEAQINPHFLLDALNTIALRARGADLAGTSRMVEQLSELVRRTLRRRTTEASLGEELELVRMYLEIEQARFPEGLRASVDIDAAALSAAVPSFALQHLVENAVRHGIAKRPGAGLLEITARRGGGHVEIAVADDGPGINETSLPPRGHGIDNTRERLKALYGEDAGALLMVTRRAEGGTLAVLRIPYHRAEPADLVRPTGHRSQINRSPATGNW